LTRPGREQRQTTARPVRNLRPRKVDRSRLWFGSRQRLLPILVWAALACPVFAAADYAYQTNRLTPWMGGTNYARDDYQWYATNTGQPDQLYSNGVYVSSEPGGNYDLGLPPAWKLSCGSNIVVGVIDTGVATNHPDLTNAVTGGWEFDDRDGISAPTYGDYSGHGTVVCGLIAAADAATGFHGVAPAAKLKVVQTRFQPSEVVKGIYWCVTNGCRIINLAWGESTPDPDLSNACLFAQAAGVIIVCAVPDTQQDIDTSPDYPSSFGFDNLVPVTSLGRTGGILNPGASGYGTNVIGAPGDNIVSTRFDFHRGFYWYASGTSCASALVTGVLALVESRYPNQSYQAAIAALMAGCSPNSTSYDALHPAIYGNVNAYKALLAPRPLLVINHSLVCVSGLVKFRYALETSQDFVHWFDMTNFTGSGVMAATNGFFRVRIL
jgi:subtilisin family serine protease